MYKVKYNKNITHDHLSANPCLDPSSLSQEVNSNGHPVTTRLFVVFWRKQKSTHGATQTSILPIYITKMLLLTWGLGVEWWEVSLGYCQVMGSCFSWETGFPTYPSRVQEGGASSLCLFVLPGGFDPNVLFSCITLSGSPWADESSCPHAFWIRTSTTYSSITCCVWMWAPLTNRIEPKALSNQWTARLVWTSFTQICRDSFHLNPQNSFRDLIMFSVNPFSSTCLREQRFALENYSETVFIAFVCEQPQLCSGGFVIPWDLIRPGYPGCFFSLPPYFSRLEAGTFPVIHIRPSHKIQLQK